MQCLIVHPEFCMIRKPDHHQGYMTKKLIWRIIHEIGWLPNLTHLTKKELVDRGLENPSEHIYA